MQAAGRERQHGGESLRLGGGQALALDAAVSLSRGTPFQGQRKIVVHVPLQAAGALRADVIERVKVLTIPEAAGPQPLKAFDQPIALGFARRVKFSSMPTY